MPAKRFALAALAALAIAGCGGGGGSDSDLADLVPPGALVFAEGDTQPSGELSADVDALARRVAGVGDLGDLVAEKLEDGAGEEGGELDFTREIEPWLGERAAVSFSRLDGDGDPAGYALVLSAADPAGARSFIDHRVEAGDDPAREGSYEGVEYWTEGGDGTAIGMVGEALVQAEDARSFKAAVDAAEGDSLADEARFQETISAASDGSLADVYLDLGGLLDASGDRIDPRARQALRSAGVDPSEATAVASLIPGSDRIQIDVSSDLGGEEAPRGDVSELLGTLPADSFAAFAVSGFGDQLKEAIDELDSSGVPGEVPPNQLKSTLKATGIDLDSIAGSLEDAAVFAQGESEGSLRGAMVLTGGSREAARAVAKLGTLLRGAGAVGVTAVRTGGASGFSVRSEDLGRKPLVVLAKGDRIAVAYGLPAALDGLDAGGGGPTLASDSRAFGAAVSALGETSISAFVDGPAALRLADRLVPSGEDEYEDARPYLKKISYIGVGSGADDEVATAKVIVGVGE
jgi:hypothetical protein